MSQLVVAHVVSNGFLRDVFVVGVKRRGEEPGTAVFQFVSHYNSFVINNNKHVFYYY